MKYLERFEDPESDKRSDQSPGGLLSKFYGS
jgi:hypothetical protein